MSLYLNFKHLWMHPLNRGGRGAALRRFVQWQVASRLFPSKALLPFVNDTSLLAERGMTGATGNFYCGLHEFSSMGLLLHLLRPDDLFVDIGANVGSYTVMVSGAIGAGTVSVEPIPATFDVLETNIAINGISEQVDAHRIGLSETSGLLRFTKGRGTVNRVLAENEDCPSIEVPVRTLDELLAGREPTAIKIDVEGYEISVLEGGRKTLSSPALQAVVMETDESGACYGRSNGEQFALMAKFGFRPYGYDPVLKRLVAGVPDDVNTLFIRDEAFVTRRIATAPEYRLVNGLI